MKKLFFLVPVILLVAAGCNQAAKDSQLKGVQKDQGQQAALSDNNLPQGEKTGWQTYSNDKYGFTIQYPNEFSLYTDVNKMKSLTFIPVCEPSMAGCLYYPKEAYKNTNFEGAGISLDVLKDPSPVATCLSDRDGQRQGSNIVINNINFSTCAGAGAATGHWESFKKYRTIRNGTTVEITLRVTATNIGVYEPGTVKEFNEKEVWNKLDQVLSTFKFTETVSNDVGSNIFSYSNIKVGQKIGSMTVVKASSISDEPITSKNNVKVEFSGTVTLVGTLSAPTSNPDDAGMGPDYSISNLTPDSLKKLPYMESDTRPVWFGIANAEIIKGKGFKNQDKVEVVINKYHYVYYEAAVWNSANLVSIKKVQ